MTAWRRTYKMLRTGRGKTGEACSLTVPQWVARELGEGDQFFECSVTEDGLLYRPVEPPTGESGESVDVPAWLSGEEGAT